MLINIRAEKYSKQLLLNKNAIAIKDKTWIELFFLAKNLGVLRIF
jgi:hypothetical protein